MSKAAVSFVASATTQQVIPEIVDLLIVGGGLSGLLVAHDYHFRCRETSTTSTSTTTTATIAKANEAGVTWKLLEARPVLGGRLVNDDKGYGIDLGGAWVWPQHQPNLRSLVSRLDVSTFPQPDDDVDNDPSSTLRIDGGAVALIEVLSRNLPAGNIIFNAPVTKCTLVVETSSDDTGDCADEKDQTSYVKVETKATIHTQNSNNDNNTSRDGETTVENESSTTTLRARRVVIAVPPKLISKHIQFDPPLSLAKQQAMETSHTWMAGVTKIALVYPTHFWKNKKDSYLRINMGLPTHWGPAFQVYDASTRDGTVAAITFFALVEPNSPALLDEDVLAKQVTNQLARVWDNLKVDSDAIEQLLHSYTDVHVHRWPMEDYISEDSAPQRIHPHPHPVRALSKSEWQGTLLFAGSESDLISPGVMEGAIGAAHRVLQDIP
jgi:monoamine oxidase